MTVLTYERAAELLRYEPDTGKLYWKVDRGNKIRAGDEAGTWDRIHDRYLRRDVFIDGKTYVAPHVIHLLMTGRWPNGQMDHINGAPTDNRWNNLRVVTPARNARNRGKKRSAKTSGFRGVSWNKNRGKWQISIGVNGRLIYCGLRNTLEEAILERLEAEATYWGYHPENERA